MFAKFEKRSLELERLDRGDYTRSEYLRWQKEMRYIHGVFGEARALRRTLIRDAAGRGMREKISILDVGAGSGGLLTTVKAELSEPQVFVCGLEIEPEAVVSILSNRIAAVQADGQHMPFADNSFTFVICSLTLHHLDDSTAVALLREMRRVARRRMYVIDLDRQPVPYYLYKLFGPLFFQRFTIEDGLLSILRSRKAAELDVLARNAGLTDIKIEAFRANRLVLSGR